MSEFPDSGDVKAVLLEWCKEKAEEANVRRLQAAFAFNKAVTNIHRHDGAITDVKTLKLIPGIGEKTITNFRKHLVKYCKDNKYTLPRAFDLNAELEEGLNKRKNEENDKPKKRRKKAPYIPRKRSGGYAILLALYLKDRNRAGLKKDEIIEVASKYCDLSFKTNPGGNEFYSAWNSIKQLEKHELVTFTGRHTLFFITDEGIEVAKKLQQVEGIKSSPFAERTHYQSFDNGLRPTPDNSNIFTSDDILLVNDPKDLLPPHLLNSSPIKPRKVHDKKNNVFDSINYSLWKPDEYDVIVLIDNREIRSQQDRTYFEERLNHLSIKCEVRQLPVGDVAWIAKHKKSKQEAVLNSICERKRLDDLAASIKDGRFMEQKTRLQRSLMKRYFYLVEDPENRTAPASGFSIALENAQCKILTMKNFFLRRFKHVDETTQFLARMTRVIQESLVKNEIKLVVMKPRVIQNTQEYCEMSESFRAEFETEFTKSKYECCHLYTNFKDTLGKSQMHTVKEVYLSMLMAIRGLSLDKALTVQLKFPTPRTLLEYFQVILEDKTDQSKALALHDHFKHEIGNKKLNKGLLQKIYEIWGK